MPRIAVFSVLPSIPTEVIGVKNRLMALDPNMVVERPLGLGMSSFNFTKVVEDDAAVLALEERLKAVAGVVKVEKISDTEA